MTRQKNGQTVTGLAAQKEPPSTHITGNHPGDVGTLSEAADSALPQRFRANAAYRVGLCVDCKTARHSAGRPRCDACHADWIGVRR